MDMLQEKKRLIDLIGTEFVEMATGTIWKVGDVSHNIYKDVVLTLHNDEGKHRELIEGSEDYYKRYMRREDVRDYRY